MTSQGFHQPTTVIVKNYTSNATGIASFVCGFISIFFLAPVFVPLTIFLGVIAIATRQFVWGGIGLVCAFIGFITSPILMGIFGISTLFALWHHAPVNQNTNVPAQHVEHYLPTPEQHRADFINLTNQIIEQIQQADSQIDGTLEKFPGGEAHYHSITAKVQSLYEKAKALPGDRYGVTRSQIIVAMNQGTIATDQLNIKVQSIKTNFISRVEPLLEQLAKAQRNCPSSDSSTDQACRELQGAGEAFKGKCQTLSAGLQNLEKTYQTELATQQALIARAEQVQ